MTKTKSAPKAAAKGSASELYTQLDALSSWLNKSKLEELEVEHNGLRVRLKKPGSGTVYAAAPQAAAAAANTAAAPAEDNSANAFTSPLVGTFYAANSPEAAPFASVGTSVKEGQVLGIVEAMKTMNQIVSDRAGTIKKVLVKNGAPVEFGQTLFIIA